MERNVTRGIDVDNSIVGLPYLVLESSMEVIRSERVLKIHPTKNVRSSYDVTNDACVCYLCIAASCEERLLLSTCRI
jgi:hypothetical protein